MDIKKKLEENLIPGMFMATAFAMILTELTGVIATISDGLITSRALGPDAYSAISLLGPFTGILLVIAGSMATGCQVIAAQYLGKGEKDRANAVFTVSFFIVLALSILMSLLCVFAPKALISACGVSMDKRPELYPLMFDYLHGYLYGIPAFMLIPLISPIIVMDGGRRLLTTGSFVLFVVNVAGDLLNVLVFHGGTFGMGIATAVSFYVQFLVLYSHFLRKKGSFRLVRFTLKESCLPEILKSGSPSLVRKLAGVLRDVTVNRLNLFLALTTAAVAARGIQNDVNLLMFCIGTGIARTLITMCGVYYSAEDRSGLRRLFSFAMQFGVFISVITGIILFAAAPLIAKVYTNDPEVISLAIFSMRCMAVALAFDTVSITYQHYLQGIKQRTLVNFLTFAERFFVPVGLALILGFTFGSKGIMASVAAGKIVMVAIMFLIVCVRQRGIPKNWEDLMFLPKGFGGAAEENLYMRITNMEEAVATSEDSYSFCLDRGIDKKTAMLVALFTEEMTGNVIRYGKPKKLQASGVDYRLSVSGGKICLTLRDSCEAFDPVRWEQLHKGTDPASNIGIRMVTKMAKEVRYFNAFNSNNLVLYLE